MLILVLAGNMQADTHSLTKKEHILVYEEVTAQVRCICLPSLPIKSCSYNNCSVSAYLKMFLENRIVKGESAATILQKMQYGFGEEILDDPVVERFIRDGNQQMVESLVRGFGPKILAEPDSTFINLTIIIAGLISVVMIFMYLKKRKAALGDTPPASKELDVMTRKYLEEIDEEQK